MRTCSGASRLRSLRSPRCGLDPPCALPALSRYRSGWKYASFLPTPNSPTFARSAYFVDAGARNHAFCWRSATVQISHVDRRYDLKVFSCCAYSTLFDSRTDAEWNALQFVRAIKRKPLRGYAHVPLPNGTRAYLDQSNATSAPEWFGQMAAARVTWDRTGRLALVPIPDSPCALGTSVPSKTLGLAEALRAALPADKAAVDVLRWGEPMPSAHRAGGTRDPQELYSRLRLTSRKLPPGLPQIVLVDDVLASGGHLRAAAAFLTDCGGCVLAAVCAGRADDTNDSRTLPFQMRTDVLPDFYPDPDWLLPLSVVGDSM